MKRRDLYVIKSSLGFLCKSIFFPTWSKYVTYNTKMFVRRGYAQDVVEKKTRSWNKRMKDQPIHWGDAKNIEVGIVRIQYLGTISEMAERELLIEDERKRD